MTDQEILEVCDKYCGNDMKLIKAMCRPIVVRYCGENESEYDDFYSVANETVWSAAKSFNSQMNISFDCYLMGCIQKRFKSIMTKRNRKRRVPNGMMIPIDAPISNDTMTTHGDLLDSGYAIENDIEELQDNNFDLFMERISTKQRRIADLIIQGYAKEEIKNILNMTEKKYMQCINLMRCFENRILLSGNYED